MARWVFFSFHYQNDIWRVSQIRNCWVTWNRMAAGFWDAADWEKVKRGSDVAIKRWIAYSGQTDQLCRRQRDQSSRAK
jgi:hypothetical protein